MRNDAYLALAPFRGESALDRLVIDDVAGLPVREFRSYQGRRHYSGRYWSSSLSWLLVYAIRSSRNRRGYSQPGPPARRVRA
jgi:hypothetical protein